MQTTVIAVIGSKSSGKTTTIEALTRELTKRGYRVAAIKHIPEPNFTIDTKDKDTWRFAKSGAKTIISAASHEIATIEKVNKDDFSIEKLLQKCKGNDVVFIEGFRKFISKDNSIYKIVTVRSAKEALESVENFEPILAFAGPYSTENMKLEVPYVDVLKNPGKIADIVEKIALKKR